MVLKKYLLLLFSFVFFVLIVPSAYGQSDLMFGQKHYYSVVFRGNGEAVVYSKIVINNPNDTSLYQMSIDIPRVNPYELTIFQQNLPPKCTRYDYGSSNNNYQKTCLEYGEADYDSYYYDSYSQTGADYQKIDYYQTGSVYNFDLPYSIPPYKSGSIIISYLAKGYAHSTLGLYKFNFETIKVPTRVTEIRVAVDVDSDLYLKGKKSKVNYNSYDIDMLAGSEGLAFKSPSLDKLTSSIGSYGSLVKEAKNLSPNESFSVKGEYSSSWLRLYITSIISFIFSIAIIFSILFLIAKLIRKPIQLIPKLEQNLPKPSVNKSHFIIKISLTDPIIFNFFMGFVSCISVIILTYSLGPIATLLEKIGFFNYAYYNSSLQFILRAIMFISGLLVYFFAIFGPAIYAANRTDQKNWKTFLVVLFAEFIWFIVLFFLLAIFFNAFSQSSPPYKTYPNTLEM